MRLTVLIGTVLVGFWSLVAWAMARFLTTIAMPGSGLSVPSIIGLVGAAFAVLVVVLAFSGWLWQRRTSAAVPDDGSV